MTFYNNVIITYIIYDALKENYFYKNLLFPLSMLKFN